MPSFRVRFAVERFFSPEYYRNLSTVLVRSSEFYLALALKLIPGLHSAPLSLHLKGGEQLRIREFWSLFVFDEIFLQRCYDSPDILNRKPIRTIIDVGANIGCFSLHAKQLWPEARIVAIEPHPTNFASLQEHVKLSGLKNITTLQVGVSDRCGSFDLYLSPRNIGGHSMYKKSDQVIRIETITLQDVLEMLGSEGSCDLLKIDCEGCEKALLSALTAEQAEKIGCIIFEPEHGLYNVDELNKRLQSLGYQVASFGDLIVCSRPNLRPKRAATLPDAEFAIN